MDSEGKKDRISQLLAFLLLCFFFPSRSVLSFFKSCDVLKDFRVLHGRAVTDRCS